MNPLFIALPFLSAALYGLGYVLIEKLLKSVHILTFTFFSSLFLFVICGAAGLLSRNNFSFDFAADKKTLLLFVATVTVNATAWIVTQVSLKNTSAEYVAFAELSYPLFTLLFLFLLFGQHQFNWHTLLGGVLVMVGAVVLVMGQKA